MWGGHTPQQGAQGASHNSPCRRLRAAKVGDAAASKAHHAPRSLGASSLRGRPRAPCRRRAREIATRARSVCRGREARGGVRVVGAATARFGIGGVSEVFGRWRDARAVRRYSGALGPLCGERESGRTARGRRTVVGALSPPEHGEGCARQPSPGAGAPCGCDAAARHALAYGRARSRARFGSCGRVSLAPWRCPGDSGCSACVLAFRRRVSTCLSVLFVCLPQ